MQQIRVLVAAARFIIRRGICALLGEEADLALAGEAADVRRAADLAGRRAPDVVLLDLELTSDDDDAVGRILARCPEARLLLLAEPADDVLVLAALRAGALGCVSARSSRGELLQGIRQVASRQSVIPSAILRRLVAAPGAPDMPEALTPREREILGLLARGWNDWQVADGAGVAVGTVRTHVSNILQKLGVDNRVAAVLFALRRGLASLDDG